MERELKFRVWDTQLYVMLTDKKDEELGDAYEPLWNLKCVRGGKLSYPLGHIMQYTGLKDKNGKEIYEGDIVVQEHRNDGDDITDPNLTFTFDGVVTWHCGGFGLQTEICDGEGTEIDLCENDEYTTSEVVGNIYENPELCETET